ncbi:hypothetical protein PMI36_01500 [Pseudomonas sp. GM79]|uniref:hypothetical protein n=1 Tax=Pseudomonas sp. GM79 TaxID=1144338 RepID=UPI00026F6A29|nr:hypothetical protein [Pseudomonas sp. GM79]EJN25882.1 hypothetical protein PMI36_01500 [Pseudomonas sp. GM79]
MKSLLLISGQSNLERCELKATADRMIQLYDQVCELGHDMRYLYPSTCFSRSAHTLRIATMLESRRADVILHVPVKNERDAYFVRWPKDVIQAYKNFTAIANSPVGRFIAKELALPNVKVSRWCEGGLVLRTNDTLVVSDAMYEPHQIKNILKHYRLLFIPSPGHIDHPGCRKMISVTHIDLHCALICTSRQMLLLVSEQYYHNYRVQVHMTAEVLGALLFVVPSSEVARRVLNLAFLPPGTVLLPDRCPRTKRFLMQSIDESNIITVKIDKNFNYHMGYGGLGCMSSIVY